MDEKMFLGCVQRILNTKNAISYSKAKNSIQNSTIQTSGPLKPIRLLFHRAWKWVYLPNFLTKAAVRAERCDVSDRRNEEAAAKETMVKSQQLALVTLVVRAIDHRADIQRSIGMIIDGELAQKKGWGAAYVQILWNLESSYPHQGPAESWFCF